MIVPPKKKERKNSNAEATLYISAFGRPFPLM
jgi:hypothetical protein